MKVGNSGGNLSIIVRYCKPKGVFVQIPVLNEAVCGNVSLSKSL